MKKKKIYLIAKILFVVFFVALVTEKTLAGPIVPDGESAITYLFSGGRFGDNLIAYMHAKWISHKFNMQLFYKPFEFSNCLALHQIEQIFSKEKEERFESKIIINNESDIQKGKGPKALYTCPYFSEYKNAGFEAAYIEVDWEDFGFKEELKKCVSPLFPVTKFILPANRISVAVHVRKGTGWDPENAFVSCPAKFPPESFYIESIRKIYDFFDKKPLYAFIFTDHTSPPDIAKQFTKVLSDLDIMFDSRKESSCKMNILEDFFALTQFDCLIRPDSHFSIAASKVADYKVIISPVHFVITKKRKVIIDQVDFQVKPK